MKTKYKYVEFTQLTDYVWHIENNRSKDFLGVLEYNKKWKEWELCPNDNTGWTKQCLVDVVDFIKQLEDK